MLNFSPLNSSAQQALLCAGVGPAALCTCTSSLTVCVRGRLAVQIWCTVIYCPYAALQPLCACTACHDLLQALMVTSLHIRSLSGFMPVLSAVSLAVHSVALFTW